MKTKHTIRVATAAFICLVSQVYAFAQAPTPCPRFPAGSSVSQPQDLFSEHGVLQVNFTYETTVDQNGNTLFCFITDSGSESPTLHLHPGDRLVINLKNNVPVATSAASNAMAAMPGMNVSGPASSTCGAVTMTA